MVEINCDQCNQRLNVPANFAGRQTQCPGCGASMIVPTLKRITPALIAAVVVGTIGSALLTLLILYPEQITGLLHHHVELSPRATCQANLNSVGKGIIMYVYASDDSERHYPPDLDALIRIGLTNENSLHCPASGHGKDVRDYIYVCPSDNYAVVDAAAIVACDIGNWHDGGGRSILRADGTVMFATDADFKTEIAKPINTKFAAALKNAEAGAR